MAAIGQRGHRERVRPRPIRGRLAKRGATAVSRDRRVGLGRAGERRGVVVRRRRAGKRRGARGARVDDEGETVAGSAAVAIGAAIAAATATAAGARIAAVVAGLSLAFVGTSATFAGTINVPADQPTIAAAISASVNGDVINIAAGTYNEHSLNTGGKAITIGSASGNLDVTIDAQQGGSVFRIESGEGDGTVIKDLSLIHI